METWLVTGGAGFIGSNFVRLALAECEARVVVIDKLTYAGHLKNLESLRGHERFHFEQSDIADREALRRIFLAEQPSAVLNFAAETHVDRSIDAPGEFVRTNLLGAFELLEASRALLAESSPAARDAFRFLHVSTDEVYGSLGPTGRFLENTAYEPNSPYSATKAGADHLVRAYHRTYGLPTLISNCSNNYGPYQFPDKLLPLMILNALEGKPLPIYGDGGHVRDWLFVEDHCRGVLAVLRGGKVGEKYNLGGDCERSNLEMLDALCEELERAAPVAENAAMARAGVSSYAELRSFVEDRPGHDRRYAIDATRARDELGWAPQHDLRSGLALTVRWYLENHEWCRAVQAGRYGGERLGLVAAQKSRA